MNSPPDFSKEDLKGTPAEFAPGAWVLGHAHFAGGTIAQNFDCSTFDKIVCIFHVRPHIHPQYLLSPGPT